jgi:uncharacterized protein with GYD domain
MTRTAKWNTLAIAPACPSAPARSEQQTNEVIAMPLYLYQAAYTAESLAAQMKNPTDRFATVAKQVKAAGVTFVTGGFSFGEHDITLVMDAPDDATAAAVAIAIGAGGAVRNGKTTPLMSGAEYIEALKKAAAIGYKPAK